MRPEACHVALMCLTSHRQYGLIGSTEFAEDFSEWLSKNLVAYINNGAFEGPEGHPAAH